MSNREGVMRAGRRGRIIRKGMEKYAHIQLIEVIEEGERLNVM